MISFLSLRIANHILSLFPCTFLCVRPGSALLVSCKDPGEPHIRTTTSRQCADLHLVLEERVNERMTRRPRESLAWRSCAIPCLASHACVTVSVECAGMPIPDGATFGARQSGNGLDNSLETWRDPSKHT